MIRHHLHYDHTSEGVTVVASDELVHAAACRSAQLIAADLHSEVVEVEPGQYLIPERAA